MRQYGAQTFYAKILSPNDNSKNQVYLGGGFTSLNIIPHDSIEEDSSLRAGSIRDRAKARVSFFWIDEEGCSPAPNTQLILYPKYPEVRMSGFLLKAERAPAELMRSREVGRILFLGICTDGRVLGHVVSAISPLARELEEAAPSLESIGIFLDLQPFLQTGRDSKNILLDSLRTIHMKGWIGSQRLGGEGHAIPYSARNGGGYTLEAELGISPNGRSEPDFLGWEVKQYGVGDFVRYTPKSPVTLMTPEPTAGLYKEQGVETFLRRHGYPDTSGKENRINFGGVYATSRSFHHMTRLALRLNGYDPDKQKITDMNGAILLLDQDENIAASWSFVGLLEHWNRKHAKAVYVPSLMQGPPPEYRYGPIIQLCEETDFLLFLKALSEGAVYYDPAIKMEQNSAGKMVIKRRSQFRIRHQQLTGLYRKFTAHSLI
ncbi:hypothetical protein JK192_15760 [Gluconobacter cerinus]|uniref:MvaI/BcnI family restriction endonuclease n=1 Tax=Gluconobacter cerinus TaxID=38307 RepID=UPI001B8B36D1|nr:MvaI/BcnI family restriction endonuclease [Gluconobacter cerinus]MBS1032816.1 hypothetical protein [Gluconobacter cerinus]